MLSVVTIADIAEAVKVKLNAATAGTFALSFTAERVPIVDLSLAAGDIDDVRVFVSGKPERRDPVTRANNLREIRVEVAVFQRLPEGSPSHTSAANSVVDPLLQLVQQLADYPGSLASGAFDSSGAKYVRTEQDAAFDRDQMNSDVFASAIAYLFYIET